MGLLDRQGFIARFEGTWLGKNQAMKSEVRVYSFPIVLGYPTSPSEDILQKKISDHVKFSTSIRSLPA